MNPDLILFEGVEFFQYTGFKVGYEDYAKALSGIGIKVRFCDTTDPKGEEGFVRALQDHANVLLRVLVHEELGTYSAEYAYYVAQRGAVPLPVTRHRVTGSIYLNDFPNVTDAVERSRKLALLLD